MEGTSIAVWDLIVLGIIVFSFLRGAMKGFVWQVATIAALILCFLFAESASVMLAPLIGLKEPLNRWVAMFVLYIVFSFVSFAIARSATEFMEKARFTEYDKHLGAVFGLVKGVALALVLTFFSVTLSEQARDHVMGTRSGKFAAVIMDRLHPVMPNELHDVLGPYIHQLDSDELDLHHHHHDHGFTADRDENEEQGSGDVAPPTAEYARLEQLLSQLPGMNDPELRKLAVSALINTEPADRGQLLDLFASGIPSLTKIIAIEWQQGKPEQTKNDAELRNRLLNEIGGIYYNSAGAQNAFREEIEDDLSGLPTQVETAVLQDWHADLMGLSPDPDPNTDFRSQVDLRIVNQLRYANVSFGTLNSALRDRLSELR